MYSESFLKQVKSFGALQYDVERMISILQPEDPDRFRIDFTDENSILFTMWKSGFNAGQYNLDAQRFELAKAEADKTRTEAETAKIKLDGYRKYAEIKQDLFGM